MTSAGKGKTLKVLHQSLSRTVELEMILYSWGWMWVMLNLVFFIVHGTLSFFFVYVPSLFCKQAWVFLSVGSFIIAHLCVCVVQRMGPCFDWIVWGIIIIIICLTPLSGWPRQNKLDFTFPQVMSLWWYGHVQGLYWWWHCLIKILHYCY